jgi:hypothetical protein
MSKISSKKKFFFAKNPAIAATHEASACSGMTDSVQVIDGRKRFGGLLPTREINRLR